MSNEGAGDRIPASRSESRAAAAGMPSATRRAVGERSPWSETEIAQSLWNLLISMPIGYALCRFTAL